MASELTIEKIVEEYGKYYVKEGQNYNRLARVLMQPSETLEKWATRVTTEDTVYRAAAYKTGSVVQPYTHAFTPKSEITFIPNEIKLNHIKTDIQIIPNEIEDSWLGFLSANNCDIKEWPIVRFIMEEYVKNQIAEDRELNMVYTGKYNSLGVTPADCMDGIRTIIEKGLINNDNKINKVEGVTEITAANALDQIEAFDKALPDTLTSKKVIIFVAPEIARYYLEAKRANGFYNISTDKEINYKIDFTNHEIYPCPAMTGSKDIFATTPDNLLWITKRYNPISGMQLQVQDREVKLLLDWWEAVGFRANQMVWAALSEAALSE